MKELLNYLHKERYCIKIIIENKTVVLGEINSHKLAILIDEKKIHKGKKLEIDDIMKKNEIRLFRLSKDEIKGLIYV